MEKTSQKHVRNLLEFSETSYVKTEIGNKSYQLTLFTIIGLFLLFLIY